MVIDTAKTEKKKKTKSLADRVDILTNIVQSNQQEIYVLEKKLDEQEIKITKLNNRHGL